jgi:hypothetical protein
MALGQLCEQGLGPAAGCILVNGVGLAGHCGLERDMRIVE